MHFGSRNGTGSEHTVGGNHFDGEVRQLLIQEPAIAAMQVRTACSDSAIRSDLVVKLVSVLFGKCGYEMLTNGNQSIVW